MLPASVPAPSEVAGSSEPARASLPHLAPAPQVEASIVFVSGDGLLHEGFNGIMQRDDADEFLNLTTLGIIPAGSANGLVKSLSVRSGN